MTYEYQFIPIEQTPDSAIPPPLRTGFQAAVKAQIDGYFQKFLAAGGKSGFNIDHTLLGAVCGDADPGKYGFVQDPKTQTWYAWVAHDPNDRAPPWLWFTDAASLRDIAPRNPEYGFAKLYNSLRAGFAARAAPPPTAAKPKNPPANPEPVVFRLNDMAERLKNAGLIPK